MDNYLKSKVNWKFSVRIFNLGDAGNDQEITQTLRTSCYRTNPISVLYLENVYQPKYGVHSQKFKGSKKSLFLMNYCQRF